VTRKPKVVGYRKTWGADSPLDDISLTDAEPAPLPPAPQPVSELPVGPEPPHLLPAGFRLHEEPVPGSRAKSARVDRLLKLHGIDPRRASSR
jgi:hypothetical protein